jgi:hypothetical protein
MQLFLLPNDRLSIEMGNKASKAASAARPSVKSGPSFPQRAAPNIGQSVVHPDPAQAPPKASNPLDGLDPHLAANLQQLGQVKVNRSSMTYSPVRRSIFYFFPFVR